MTKHKKIGFRLVFLGLCFFFNPYFAVVDILPDFIGCFLIVLGLSRAMYVNRTLADARIAFLKMMVVDLIKTLLLMVTLGAGTAEQPTALLLLAFSATAVEIFFLIVAMKALFEGLLSIATLEDCPPLYLNYHRGLSRVELLQRSTLLFIFLREFLCLLPEFLALSLSSYNDSHLNNIYDYIGLVRAFSFIVVLVLGIVWLVHLIGVFRLLWREKQFKARVEAKYASYIETHPGVPIERRFAACFILLFAAALLFTDFYIDFKNVIPDWLGAACMLFAVLLINLPNRVLKIGAILSSLGLGVVSYISSDLSYRFLFDYGVSAIDRTEEASNAYFTMWLTSLLECTVFLAALIFLLLLLRAVIQKHAGYLSAETKTEFDARARKQFLEEFDLSLVRIFLFGFLSAICSFLFDYIKKIPEGKKFRFLEYLWIPDFVLALVFACLFGNLLLQIYKEIKNRYQYD